MAVKKSTTGTGTRRRTVDVGTTTLPSTVGKVAKSQTTAATTPQNQAIPKPDTRFINTDIRTLRNSQEPTSAVRLLARINGTVSAAVFDFVQVACTEHTLLAYDSITHEFSAEGTLLAQSIVARLDTLFDFTEGFGDKQTVSSMKESMIREVALTGAVAAELVLDKARLPDRIHVVPYESLRFKSDGVGGRYPTQSSSDGGDIDLDLPTFFVGESNREAAYAYVYSMLEASVEDAFIYQSFLQDMVRGVRRSGTNRMTVLLDYQKVYNACPPAHRNDPKKLQAYLDATLSTFTELVNGMEPEDVLVMYDTAKPEMLKADGEKADYTALMNALSGNLATSLKTSPSILGLRINGSQSLSNTESLVFLKVASALQRPVEAVISRIITLACRLYGLEVYVKFKFDPIHLRPDLELEAFKTMRQSRILELLSLGLYSDDEASMTLTGRPRPAGAPALSGTMFYNGASKDMAEKASPNNGAQEKAMQPDTPSNAGGEN